MAKKDKSMHSSIGDENEIHSKTGNIQKSDILVSGFWMAFENKLDHLATDLMSTIRKPDMSGFWIPTVDSITQIQKQLRAGR